MSDIDSMYLELVKKSLTCSLYETVGGSMWRPNGTLKNWLVKKIIPPHVRMVQPTDPQRRASGKDFPDLALTMIGMKRLDNLQNCIDALLKDRVPGDLIETGVWRGGASIFMRAVLKARGVTDRRIWVADSFQGLPEPNREKYPADQGKIHDEFDYLKVPLERVKANFERFGLLDGQVAFLKGWFKDTLPTAPLGKLALIRLDGDLYESTWDALSNLYPKLSPGGFAIIDDYGAMEVCRRAVTDYRNQFGITEEIQKIDDTGVFWRRSAGS